MQQEDTAMKKVIILAALAAMALTACQQEIAIEENQPAGTVVFTATTESAPATKTALSYNDPNYDVVWSSGDKITIVDGAGTPNVGVYSTTSTTTHADFTFSSGAEATTPNYKAWYPSDIYNSGTPTLPATQTYTAGNISGSPMYAESSSNSLAFKNICGIIRLNVSTTQSGKKVRAIILSATQGMSGAISNHTTLVSAGYVATVTGTAGVALNCGASGVAISGTATPFYIAVPQNDYTSLKITVVATDGTIQTRTANTSISVARSQITDISLSFDSMAAISNLVHYWPFNGNLNDVVSEGAINATFISSSETYDATLTADRNGNANSAYSFDGYNIMSIGRAGDFGTSSFTANMWISTTAGTYINTLIRTEGSSGGAGWFIRFDNSGTEIWASSYNYISTTTINDGNWHMISFVHDTNNKVGQLYVDGVYKGGYTMSDIRNVSSDATHTHVLGSGTHYRHCVYDGKMDEVRLYNKALTADEIAALYTL